MRCEAFDIPPLRADYFCALFVPKVGYFTQIENDAVIEGVGKEGNFLQNRQNIAEQWMHNDEHD
jgi:hypothetical protein